MAYVLTHWRGAQGLFWSFWINGFALRVAIFYLLIGLTKAGPLSVALVVFVICTDLLVLLWQGIGFVRAAERNLRDLGSSLPLWGGMIAGIAAVFLVLSQWWALALVTHPFHSQEPYSEVRNRFYAAQYDLSIDGAALRFSGIVALGATAQMQKLLTAHPDVQQITLDSDGGNIFEARGMARLVQEHGLTTSVTRACSSACTLIFIAGKKRQLAPKAQLGFHGYALPGAKKMPGFDIGAEQARDRAFFRAQGVADDFVNRIHDTPSSEIWFPTRELLQAAGIVVEAR